MFLRWRRSLPTEKARSPAPVRMATRTDGVTAIVSRTSVRRAPISVVIALSACGRFNVITATRPSDSISTSTDSAGSSSSDGGGPKSSASQRSVLVGLGVISSPSSSPPLRLQLGEPTQRTETRSEAVLAAAGDDERGELGQSAPYRTLRDRERARPVVRADDRVLLGGRADENPALQPLRLHELEMST